MCTRMKNQATGFYTIIIAGEVDPSWSDWFDGFEIQSSTGSHGECFTSLTGPVHDQAALRGILNKVWNLNLELVSVNRVSES